MHGCGSGKKTIALQAALDIYTQLALLPKTSKSLLDAAGEVLAEPAYATCDLPAFTQSAMDGYAFRHADTLGVLTLVGEVPAGEVFPRTLAAGEAVRIFTGAALPEGADTVARQEIVHLDGQVLQFDEPTLLGVDVRHRAEEVCSGQALLSAGSILTPGRVAALAMAGVNQVVVHAKPRVAVIITGNEVARHGEPLKPGFIHDANGPLVASWLQAQGIACTPVWVSDDLAALTDAIAQAASTADLVITTGGASVGSYDYLPQAAEAVGFHCQFHGVAQRPGKPVWFGQKDNCVLLALPGNPAAVLIGLYVHAAAILSRLQGEASAPLWQKGRLAKPMEAHPSLVFLRRMRQYQDEEGTVWLAPLPNQASHQLSNLAEANALLWLPAGVGTVESGKILSFLALG